MRSVLGRALQAHAQFHNLTPSLPIAYTFIPYSAAIPESFFFFFNTNLIMLLSYFQNFQYATISYRLKSAAHLHKAV